SDGTFTAPGGCVLEAKGNGTLTLQVNTGTVTVSSRSMKVTGGGDQPVTSPTKPPSLGLGGGTITPPTQGGGSGNSGGTTPPTIGVIAVTNNKTYSPIPSADNKKISFQCTGDTSFAVGGQAPESELENTVKSTNPDGSAYDWEGDNYGKPMPRYYTRTDSSLAVFKNVYVYNNNHPENVSKSKHIADEDLEVNTVAAFNFLVPYDDSFHPYKNVFPHNSYSAVVNPKIYVSPIRGQFGPPFGDWVSGSLGTTTRGCDFYLYNFVDVVVRVDKGSLQYSIENL
ncbi:MAG: hypothetical protein UR93_C0016G0001, partial [Berkelbacteria bacterium GW2011_GWA2_35_9]